MATGDAKRGLTPEEFAATSWLSAVGDPVPAGVDSLGTLDEIRAAYERDPEAFLRHPYAHPYEDWCLEDHQAATALAAELRAGVSAVARRAYLAAWNVLPNPEFCGLLSDDVHTTHALLLMSRPLSQFTRERASWLSSGRVPYLTKEEDGGARLR